MKNEGELAFVLLQSDEVKEEIFNSKFQNMSYEDLIKIEKLLNSAALKYDNYMVFYLNFDRPNSIEQETVFNMYMKKPSYISKKEWEIIHAKLKFLFIHFEKEIQSELKGIYENYSYGYGENFEYYKSAVNIRKKLARHYYADEWYNVTSEKVKYCENLFTLIRRIVDCNSILTKYGGEFEDSEETEYSEDSEFSEDLEESKEDRDKYDILLIEECLKIVEERFD